MNVLELSFNLIFIGSILVGCNGKNADIQKLEQKLTIDFPNLEVHSSFGQLEISSDKVHKFVHFGLSGNEQSIEFLEDYFYQTSEVLFKIGKNLQLNQITIEFYNPSRTLNDIKINCTLSEYTELNFCNFEKGRAPNIEVIKQISYSRA